MSVHPEHYAEFLQRLGHEVKSVDGHWWFDCSPRVFVNFPFHWDVDVCDVNVSDVLGSNGLIARMTCPLDHGATSFRLICDDTNYDFPSLRKRTRTQVRRGLESCDVRQIEFGELRKQYLPLQRATHARQGRKAEQNDKQYWDRFIDSAANTTGAETWASFVDGKMAAYLISFTILDTANLCIVRSSTELLKSYPNNALLFVWLQDVLSRPEVRQVSYGLESVQVGGEKLDQFKSGMGFRKEPCGQRIMFANKLNAVLKRPIVNVIQPCVRRFLPNETGRKLDGVLTWYQTQPSMKQIHSGRAA